MIKGYNKIFWGTFFSLVTINIGGIKILPAFISWAIITSGISELRKVWDNKNIGIAQNISTAKVFVLAALDILSFNSLITPNFLTTIVFFTINNLLSLLAFGYLFIGSIEKMKAYKNIDISLYENSTKNFLKLSFLCILLGLLAFSFLDSPFSTILFVTTIILIIYHLLVINRFKNFKINNVNDKGLEN